MGLVSNDELPGCCVALLLVVGLSVVAAVVLGIRHGGSQVRLAKDIDAWRGTLARLRSSSGDRTDWDAWLASGEALAARCDRAAIWSQGNQSNPVRDLAESIRADVRAYGAARSGVHLAAAIDEQPTLADLARLRAEGMISQDEFRAFSDRFKRAPGAKAQEIIGAIEALHVQYKKGAMSEGNYRASLWTMLDRLDSATRP